MTEPNSNNIEIQLDALVPLEMAAKAEQIGGAVLVGAVYWFVYLRKR